MGLFDVILRSDSKVRGTGIKGKRQNDQAELRKKQLAENEERRLENLKLEQQRVEDDRRQLNIDRDIRRDQIRRDEELRRDLEDQDRRGW